MQLPWAGWVEAVDLDALILHFFGAEDPSTLTEAEFELGIERLRIAFGMESEPGRKFGLWTLMEGLGIAPFPADAFPKHPQLRAAADVYLTAAWRTERDHGNEGVE